MTGADRFFAIEIRNGAAEADADSIAVIQRSRNARGVS
jgi:hypothetical protein